MCLYLHHFYVSSTQVGMAYFYVANYITNIFNRKLSIEKTDVHGYRDNISYFVNYYREFLRNV